MTPEDIELGRKDLLVVAEILLERSKEHDAAGREHEATAFDGYAETCRYAAAIIKQQQDAAP